MERKRLWNEQPLQQFKALNYMDKLDNDVEMSLNPVSRCVGEPMAIPYTLPDRWVKYDRLAVADSLIEAKSAVKALIALPMQKAWAEELQKVQLRAEVAGTSRIEGAEFTERELDEALGQSADEGRLTRSQREARAAERVYRWIARQADDRPIDRDLVCEIHRRLVSEARDDRTPPGIFRRAEQNVTFGMPPHRGAVGGAPLEQAFRELMNAVRSEFRSHDPLMQALALHYHIGAMHPFLDWNGRTGRALEAFMLQKAGLKEALFIALANYYYEEKHSYLEALSAARAANHDLTSFLIFGLRGIALQCARLSGTISLHIRKALFRDMANDLFGRLENKRKRVIGMRQLRILTQLLDAEMMEENLLFDRIRSDYQGLRHWERGVERDLESLERIGAIQPLMVDAANDPGCADYYWKANLDWPSKITETEFFRRFDQMPDAKSSRFALRPNRSRRR